jgi:urease accessory protein
MPPFVLDGHMIEIIAGAGSRAVVTGQSATRVHPALESFSTQQWSIEVEDDACLVILPGPTIPYRGCRYYQRGRVELAPRARLIWGDIWLAGRYERGGQSERFAFERIVQDFEVRRSGRLIYRDRFRWDGPWGPSESDWHFGGSLAAASLFVAGPSESPNGLPDVPPRVRRAALPIGSGDLCVRWCGHPPEVVPDVVRCAMHLASRHRPGSEASPWLIDSTELAPNHWFSI